MPTTPQWEMPTPIEAVIMRVLPAGLPQTVHYQARIQSVVFPYFANDANMKWHYKYYQTFGLKLIHRGFFRQYNYGVPLKELEV